MRVFLFSLILLFINGTAWATDYTVNANCVGAWLLDEASGNTIDSSSGGHDGVVTGATQNVTGKFGKACSFDGNNDYITVSANLINNSFSIIFDYYITSWTTNANVLIQDGSGGFSIYFDRANWVPGQSNEIISNWDSAGYVQGTGSDGTSTDAWHNICVMYDVNDDLLELYIDGTQIDTTSETTAHAGNASFTIGTPNADSWYSIIGSVDDVGVFSDKLTSTEITDIITNGLKPAVVAGAAKVNRQAIIF